MRNPRKIWKNPTFLKSWSIAARGLMLSLRSERKVRLAVVVLIIFAGLALWMNVSRIEIILIIAVWIQVIVGEIFNTALEKAMDYASGKEFHPLIKLGKDYAAGSVFLLSVLAAFVSIFILVNRFF